MRRSYSQDFITNSITPTKPKPVQNFILTGKLVKKVPDPRSAQWNGLVLSGPTTKPSVRNSPMRWQEYQSSKRTLNPEYNNEKPKARPRRSSSTSSNLFEMISKGYSEEKIGKLNKKVVLNGKQVTKNAASIGNYFHCGSISEAYSGIHTGHIPSQEKPHIKITEMSKAKKTSQIYTLPGGPKDNSQQVTVRPHFDSKIVETSNPCMRQKRNKDLSIEKEKLILSFASFYDKNPLEFDFTPSKQGKLMNTGAFERIFKGGSPDHPAKSPKRKRPEDSKDIFKSSITLC